MKHVLLASAFTLLACAPVAAQDVTARANMIDQKEGEAGTVTFRQTKSGYLHVIVEMTGLPAGPHGFHVHEKGDCSSGDGMSAGGHFNPAGRPHGRHGQGMHHAGDLVSLRADANGVARFNFESPTISVGGGPADIVGKGLIVHRDPDDYTTQPTGNAGARLACAVIVRS